MEPTINSGKARIKLTGTGGEGFYVEVTPLTLATRQALIRKALALYPDPDPAAFVQSRAALGLPPAFGDDAGDDLPGEENPAYREALAEVERLRGQWLTDTAVDICVTSDHRDAYVKLYAEQVAKLHEHGLSDHLLPWPDVLQNFLCGYSPKGDVSEWNILFATVNAQMPLQEGDIIEGMRYFRLDLQRYLLRGLVNPARPRSAKEDGADTPEPANGRDGGGAGVGLPDGNDREPEPELVGGLAG